MTSLLEICEEAIELVIGLNVPTTIFGNDDPDAIGLKRSAMATGRELVRKYSWQALMTPTTFVTADTVYQYAIPADFQRFANGTFYNVTQARRLFGPELPAPWAQLTRGLSVGSFNYSFRVRGNYIEVSPTPSTVETVGYDYYSKQYCTSAGGTAQDDWQADTDLPRLNADLLVLGVRWRFKYAKGLPFETDRDAYSEAISDLLWDDTPKADTSLSGVPRVVGNTFTSTFSEVFGMDSDLVTMDSG